MLLLSKEKNNPPENNLVAKESIADLIASHCPDT
jgi:hypothetical protein